MYRRKKWNDLDGSVNGAAQRDTSSRLESNKYGSPCSKCGLPYFFYRPLDPGVCAKGSGGGKGLSFL